MAMSARRIISNIFIHIVYLIFNFHIFNIGFYKMDNIAVITLKVFAVFVLYMKKDGIRPSHKLKKINAFFFGFFLEYEK